MFFQNSAGIIQRILVESGISSPGTIYRVTCIIPVENNIVIVLSGPGNYAVKISPHIVIVILVLHRAYWHPYGITTLGKYILVEILIKLFSPYRLRDLEPSHPLRTTCSPSAFPGSESLRCQHGRIFVCITDKFCTCSHRCQQILLPCPAGTSHPYDSLPLNDGGHDNYQSNLYLFLHKHSSNSSCIFSHIHKVSKKNTITSTYA